MALLQIKTYPDDVLKLKCSEVAEMTEIEQKLADDMIETMLSNRGVGLAAPQVGVSKRLIVCAPRGDDKEVYVFINPIIKKKEGEATEVEGCLSIPCASGDVTRAKKIWVEARDRDGKKVSFQAHDFMARIIQHETDHLDGVLFIDHLGFEARKQAIDCARKVSRL